MLVPMWADIYSPEQVKHIWFYACEGHILIECDVSVLPLKSVSYLNHLKHPLLLETAVIEHGFV